METSILIMAAGIGSRFGTGIKQLEPVDDANHIIMDYSIHDAMEAGFNHVVFIIRKDIEKEFKEVIGDRIASICSAHNVTVDYAFQDIKDIPGTLPEGRTKPWGTGQAVLAAKKAIDTPFIVITLRNSKLFYQHRNHRLRLLDLAVDHGNRTDRAVCRENFPVCIKNPAARRLDPALPLVQIIRLLGTIDGPEHTQIHQPPGKSDHHSHAEYPQKNRLFPVIRFVFTHRIPHSRIHYDNTIWKLLWGYVFCFLCFFTLH